MRRRLERDELIVLLVGVGVCAGLFLFIRLAGEVMRGDTQAFDVQIVRGLRSAADPSIPKGPVWLQSVLLDMTALGSGPVLGLIVLIITGYLLLVRRLVTASIVLVTFIGGEIVDESLKALFMRPRPSVVPHLQTVVTTSFPSGHAMDSAIIYLTLGALLVRVVEGRFTKIYCMSIAIFLTLIVGVSRVYLGVHYPTDVLGGWMLGFLWAALTWLMTRRFDRTVSRERAQQAE
ncbi:MAG TPA: phosphatase PAP2 family protein [Vicinamibacterales bacterium]|nr:phosphatase PAP2 family protein [Vicinamibacterales bacterium]